MNHLLRRQRLEMAALALLCLGLLSRPQAAAQGFADGARLCVGSLLPALFPFMVVCELLVGMALPKALLRPQARLLGLQRAESKVTEAEIRSIIQEGAEDGEVQAVEQQIMGRVFSLGDRTVESIMTHRSELAWIDAAASAAQIRETVARAPHNRYPVGEGSLDKLLGVVCLKDLFLHLGDEEFDLRRLVAPAKFFHEGFEVYNALEQLRTEQLGYGIICDEFGVTRGIITLRDIFEALVGELPDPREEPDIVRREDGSCLVDGQCPFYDFLDWFGLENALPCNAYNTVSGLILDQLAHIPATGEKLEWNGFTFEIVDMDGARIDKILVSQKQQP